MIPRCLVKPFTGKLRLLRLPQKQKCCLNFKKKQYCHSTSAKPADKPYLKKGHLDSQNEVKTFRSFFGNTQSIHYLTCM